MICPAYAGMIPVIAIQHRLFQNLSRVCGDDPIVYAIENSVYSFVPRMRG